MHEPLKSAVLSVTDSSSNGVVSIGVTVATTIVVFIFSSVLGFVMGVGVYYILLKKLKLKTKTKTGVQPRETAPEIRIQESREIDQEVVYSNQETQQQNEDLTHSYCEADDPIKGTSVFTKPSGKLFPNESYVESKKQCSRPEEEMRLKANLSYGEVRSSGATKVDMEANHSYGLVRETTDLDKRVEYDYVDNELFGDCK